MPGVGRFVESQQHNLNGGKDMDLERLITSIRPEHLISMAVAFIFVVSACASLIISANSKIDRISSRFRHACELWREQGTTAANLNNRREYLKKQVDHFYGRYVVMQKVQRFLFDAIRMFIAAYFFYIFTSGFVVINMSFQDSVHPPMWLIAGIIITLSMITGLFIWGISLMLRAAHLQVKETADSHKTLEWERQDIIDFYNEGTPNKSFEPTAS